MVALGLVLAVAAPAIQAQSSGSQSQNPTPGNSKPAQDIPDAPSAVQPPAPQPAPSSETPPAQSPNTEQAPSKPGSAPPAQPADLEKPAPPPMPPLQTVPAGSLPKNQIDPKEDLYKISVTTNFVQIPVIVKDKQGRRVDGLLSRDFTVLENGKEQKLSYFTSDPFQLSVAILLDLGMADVAVQKINLTYSAL